MNKIEFKLFVTFLFIPFIFSYWTSWNEETNFVLIKVMVEDCLKEDCSTLPINFYLEKYRNITGDLNCLKEHCFASSFRWQFLIFGIPIYTFLRLLTNNESAIKFFLSLLTSGLFSSLSVLLIYKISKKILRKRSQRIGIAFCYGFATLPFQQMRFFTTHSTEAFIAILASYFLFQLIEKKGTANKHAIIFGIWMGIGLLMHVFEFLSFLLFLILIIRRKRKEAIIFLLSAFLVLAFLLFPPFFIIAGYLPPPLQPPSLEISLMGRPFFPKEFESTIFPLSNFFQLLIFPSKGILFYYPLLIFSFIGFFFVKKLRVESFSFLFFIIITILAISVLQPMWWFGWVSYGPSRVLTVLMPFFAIGLMGFVKRFGFKILVPFVLISTFYNFLLLQYGEDKISTLSWEEYKYKMEHFQVLSNPLFEHYLPLTLINGPRSILLENLLINKKISIDFKHPYNPETPEFVPPGSSIMKKFEVYLFFLPKIGIIVLRLPWLSLFIIGILLFLIWKGEIFGKIRINNWMLVSILILIFLASFIRVRNVAYGDNWCAPQWDENNKRLEESRWIGQNATLYFFSKENTEKILRLSAESFKNNQTLEIYLNGKFIGNYTIQKRKEISQPIKLKEGVNELMLRTKGDFIPPWLIGVSCDIDLVSFKISKIHSNED
jgi:uncharacterized protein YxeA